MLGAYQLLSAHYPGIRRFPPDHFLCSWLWAGHETGYYYVGMSHIQWYLCSYTFTNSVISWPPISLTHSCNGSFQIIARVAAVRCLWTKASSSQSNTTIIRVSETSTFWELIYLINTEQFHEQMQYYYYNESCEFNNKFTCKIAYHHHPLYEW